MTVFYPLQRSIAPSRRTARWVGKPRIKLAEQLDKKLTEMGYECEIEVDHIRPQQGAWRTDFRLDVMRLEGSLKIKGPATGGCMMNRNLESWSTITEMLRYGFSVEVQPFAVTIGSLKGSPEAKQPRQRPLPPPPSINKGLGDKGSLRLQAAAFTPGSEAEGSSKSGWLPIEEYDNGEAVYLDGYSGGAAPEGSWGRLWLRFTRPGQPDERRAYVAKDVAQELGTAAHDVLAERRRQVAVEGWTPEHDDEHDGGEIAIAAATYAIGATVDGPERSVMDEFGASGTVYRVHSLWPWDISWFRPTSRRRDLVKAGALILAEIERLDRALPTCPVTQDASDAQTGAKLLRSELNNPTHPEGGE